MALEQLGSDEQRDDPCPKLTSDTKNLLKVEYGSNVNSGVS